MNWTGVGEIVLAVMITEMDMFNRLLGTVPLKAAQFGLALGAAVLLLVLWESGKWLARRQDPAAGSAAVTAADAAPTLPARA